MRHSSSSRESAVRSSLGRRPSSSVTPAWVKQPRAGVVGRPQVAMEVVDDAHHAPAAARSPAPVVIDAAPRTGPPSSGRAARRRSARRWSGVPARPRRAASAGSLAMRHSASAKATADSDSTSSPLSPVERPARGCPTRWWKPPGRPAAIASIITLGMPSRSPSSVTRQARVNTPDRRYSSNSSSLAERAEELDRVTQPGGGDQPTDLVTVVALLPGDGDFELDSTLDEQFDGLDEDVEALLLDEAADADHPEPIGRVVLARRRRRAARSRR